MMQLFKMCASMVRGFGTNCFAESLLAFHFHVLFFVIGHYLDITSSWDTLPHPPFQLRLPAAASAGSTCAEIRFRSTAAWQMMVVVLLCQWKRQAESKTGGICYMIWLKTNDIIPMFNPDRIYAQKQLIPTGWGVTRLGSHGAISHRALLIFPKAVLEACCPFVTQWW